MSFLALVPGVTRRVLLPDLVPLLVQVSSVVVVVTELLMIFGIVDKPEDGDYCCLVFGRIRILLLLLLLLQRRRLEMTIEEEDKIALWIKEETIDMTKMTRGMKAFLAHFYGIGCCYTSHESYFIHDMITGGLLTGRRSICSWGGT
ncbi:hypothetical protein QBC32DRAFT_43039 [Pseudoneurospora amorphoporcata]|uniref:Uncharacterized protein n=1 Tax=Pseudoneurospora amorphoporcata TaxID=241081 RepID=A0AAN6P273_9PEZI|nr:hypothetical protein QBC32DRAFT_43039 [Pseudoneurospora amorphoporcata]